MFSTIEKKIDYLTCHDDFYYETWKLFPDGYGDKHTDWYEVESPGVFFICISLLNKGV